MAKVNDNPKNINRFEILHRDKFRCVYCGATSDQARLMADHIVPVSKGGPNTADNLVTSCHRCNYEKWGGMMSEDMLNRFHKLALRRCIESEIDPKLTLWTPYADRVIVAEEKPPVTADLANVAPLPPMTPSAIRKEARRKKNQEEYRKLVEKKEEKRKADKRNRSAENTPE